MATTFNTNSGIHQLPSNCYPPSESDDEDSFVVLNNSLGPDVHTDRAHLNTEPISTETIEASLQSLAKQASQNVETHTQLHMNSSHINLQSTEISPDEIQKKVDNLIAENLKLKETLAQNNIAMKKQVDTITQWQEEVQRVQESHKEKFTDMKKYIAMLKAENEELKDIVKKTESRPVEEDAVKTKEILVKQAENIKQFEFEAAQKRIKELEKALDILSLEKERLSKEMSDKKQELTNVIGDKELLKYELDLFKQKENSKQNSVTSEMQNLKDEIVELRDTNNNLADQVLRLQNQNEKLKLEVANREEKLSSINSTLVTCQQDLSQTKQQLMSSQMHITELKETHMKTISEKDKEIGALQQQLGDLQTDADENAVLRAQLDLYKNDFEMERAQRKELLTEKNVIVDDLQQLQRRNKQLLEEVDQLRSGFVPVKKEEARAAPSQQYSCPRCAFRFSGYQELENHVYRCIELDILP